MSESVTAQAVQIANDSQYMDPVLKKETRLLGFPLTDNEANTYYNKNNGSDSSSLEAESDQ